MAAATVAAVSATGATASIDGSGQLAFTNPSAGWGSPGLNFDRVMRVTHGFYLTRVRGVLSLHVWESGAVAFGPTPVAIGAVLDVIRFGSRVSYRVNGATIYVSRTPSTGTIKVAASLYGPEDTVG